MPFMNREVRRVWHMHPGSFGVRALAAGVRQRVLGAPGPLRILLLSDGVAYTSEQQFAPLARHAGLLRQRFGATFQHRRLNGATPPPASALGGFDIVGFKLGFRTPPDAAAALARGLRQACGADTRLVYFDGDDDACVQWPEVLDAVDLYVKKHVFRDRDTYGRVFEGKNNLTDHVARTAGRSFADDIIPRSRALAPGAADRLHLGWNVALDDKIVALAHRLQALAPPARDIDLSCRGAVAPTVWTHPMREGALRAMEAMADRWRVLAPRDRVSQAVYDQEMLRSRLCVSPFGYGEICWRDFEAILCGCLLVKPDMSHLQTLPDLFEAGVTYVPVRWDYADLAERCEPFLADEAARQAMAERARQRLLTALGADAFAAHFAHLLTPLRLPAHAAPRSLP
jgi:hypothetical protein